MTPTLPRWADVYLLPIINLVMALIVSGIVIAFVGENPFEALQVMINGAFFYGNSLGYTLYYTTNFIFTGLAVAVAFQALLFNIGGEGQAYIGGLFAALAAFAIGPIFPWFLALPIVVMAAALGGASWAFIPGVLQAKRDSHIVITTIMFNFLAAALMVALLSNTDLLMQSGQQSPQTAPLPEAALMPKGAALFDLLGINSARTPLNLSFLVGIACLFIYWVLIWRTRLGYEIRAVGKNPDAAKYAGIKVPRVIIITLLISGAFAGMMAVNEILGVHSKVILNFTAGYGFTGIAVALMGRNHPFGIFLASLLFGALFQGGVELDFEFTSITREMVLLIQGLIILFSGALAYMMQKPLARVLALILAPKVEAANG